MRYKRIGYNVNVMRQSACLVINPITVDGYATLFKDTDSTAPKRGSVLMTPDGAIWSRYQRAVLMR